MLKQIRRARDSLRVLPVWVRIIIATQCLLPSIVQWYQLKFLVSSGVDTNKLVAMLDAFHTLSKENQLQLTSMFAEAMLARLTSSGAFNVLVMINTLLSVLGLAIPVLLVWRSNDPQVTP